MSRILVIDDEPQIRKFLRISLAANGYEVAEADCAGAGMAALQSTRPDLVILDLGLPDMDGQEVISAIREQGVVPVIVLSVRQAEGEKIEALDRGADDYVVKPFGIGELMARVRAALRQKAEGAAQGVVQAGNVRIDLPRRIVSKNGLEVHLSRREFELLRCLAEKPDHVLSHQQILKAVWGPAHVQDTAYLRVYMNQLRQKLEDNPSDPQVLLTEAGVGYRLKA